MANPLEVSDEEWQTIHPILAVHEHVRVASEAACRAILVAVLRVLRSGAQWRLLPTEHGKWNSVFKRISRWCRYGIWDSLHMACAHLPDLQTIFIDSTVIRAHPCAAGAVASNAEAEALGRSRGGFGTKIHDITDALGNPLHFVLTGGQASDMDQAETLLELTPAGAEAFVGDKGYDRDALVQAIEARDRAAIIPPRSHRAKPRKVDGFVYKKRQLIKCFFNKMVTTN
jgi:transposase